MKSFQKQEEKNLINHLKENKHHYKISALLSLAFVVVILVPVIYYTAASITTLQTTAIQEKNSAIETAILNNDYTAWASIETDKSLKSQINSSNFNQFTEAFRFLQQGKLEEANIIKKTISLRADLQEATNKSALITGTIKDDNYIQWRGIVGPTFETQINSFNFSSYAQSYRLIMQGKLKQSNYVKIRSGIKIDSGTSSSR